LLGNFGKLKNFCALASGTFADFFFFFFCSLQTAPEGWPPKYCQLNVNSTCSNPATKLHDGAQVTLKNVSCASGLSADWSGDNIGTWAVWNWHPLLMTIAFGGMAAQGATKPASDSLGLCVCGSLFPFFSHHFIQSTPIFQASQEGYSRNIPCGSYCLLNACHCCRVFV